MTDTAQDLAALRRYYRSIFDPPFFVQPLSGKYYGTKIVEAGGVEMAKFWSATGEPSAREKARFGDRWTPEFWRDYCCDSHWECEADLEAAEALARILNATPTAG